MTEASQDAVLYVRGQGDPDDVWDDTALIEAYDRAVSLAKDEVARRMGLPNASGSHQKEKSDVKSTWQLGDYCQCQFSEDNVVYEAFVKDISRDGRLCTVCYVGYENEEIVSLDSLKPSGGKHARKMQKLQARNSQADMCFSGDSSVHSCSTDMSAQQKAAHPKMPKSKHKQQEEYCSSKSSFAANTNGHGPQPQISQNMAFQPSPCHLGLFSLPPWNNPGLSLPSPPPPPPPPPPPIPGMSEEDNEALSSMLMSWYMSGYHTGYYQGLKRGRMSSGTEQNH